MGCLPTVWGQAVMGTKGADVCPCSAQAWLIRVSAWRLLVAVSNSGESRGGASVPGPQSCLQSWPCSISAGSQAELGLEEVPGSLPHSP